MPVRTLETGCPCSSGAFPDAFLTRLPLEGQRSSQPCPPSAHLVERPCRDPRSPTAAAEDAAAGTLVVEEPRFAIVPEWVIDAAVSDGAFRLYSLLLRYGNGSGCRMPSRQTLARRLRRSVDAVDRAMRQLTEAGIVRVEHRRSGEQFLSNRYHVRTTAPAARRPPMGVAANLRLPPNTQDGWPHFCGYPWPHFCGQGGRRSAAQPRDPYRQTSSPYPLTPRPVFELRGCGGGRRRAPGCVRHCRPRRPGPAVRGRPSGSRQADRPVDSAVPGSRDQARRGDQRVAGGIDGSRPSWPLPGTETAARRARVAEAGPWWDAVTLGADQALDAHELAAMEARLAETDGLRPALQAQARAELTAEGMPVIRSTVARRACAILDIREAQ